MNKNGADEGALAFITKWQGITASELSTSQSFLIDLCALLGVDMPHATAEQDYMFERPITFAHGDDISIRALVGAASAAITPTTPAYATDSDAPAAIQSPRRSDVSRDPPNGADDVQVATHVASTVETGIDGAMDELAAEAAPTKAAVPDMTRDDAKRAFDETILERLVALNAQRAAADVFVTSPVPLSLDEIDARFTARGPWKKRLAKLVEMLVALGRAQEQDGKIGAA